MEEYDHFVFAKLCRTCLTETSDLRSIFKSGKLCGQSTTLSVLLADVTSLTVSKDDGLPECVCGKCMLALGRAFSFKQQSLKAAETLTAKLAEIKSKNEEILAATAEQQDNLIDDQSAEDEQHLEDLQADDDVVEDENGPAQENEDIKYGEQQLQQQYFIHESEMEEHLEEVEPEASIESVEETTPEETIKKDPSFEIESMSVSDLDAVMTDNSFAKPSQTTPPIDGPDQKVVFRNIKRQVTVRASRPPADFACPKCGKVLSNNSSYKYHMQLHSDATPFVCQECGVGFKTKNALAGHQATHQKNPANTCHICSKSYRQAASLRSHMASAHQGIKPFVCNICGRGCTQKSGYKKHMLTHTGEKPYACEFCGRNFRFSSNLIIHKRSHTGDKPYQCNVCEKAFPGSEQLKRHVLVHTGERPYLCEHFNCGKRFNRMSSLRVHQNLHTGHKKYMCTVCPKSYIQANCLKTHMASAHKIHQPVERGDEG